MTIPVSLGERSYPILVEPDLLSQPQIWPQNALAGEIFLVSNSTIWALYGENLQKSLEARGARVTPFLMGDGEAHKSLETASRAFDAMASAPISRGGAVWALGGGVTGDLAGFVAATWMRGVAFVQVPTTLLAMVDSSVGGKTGVNHPRAKNLLGAFWQPQAVLIDPNCLKTLPPREFAAGLAEVIKYGVIADPQFFEWLEENLDAVLAFDGAALAHIIARSCEIKALVVGQDERESDSVGRRAILNYGHTVGHALEATTKYGELLHGEAIAMGMTVEARLGIEIGTISREAGTQLLERQTQLFERAGLPTQTPQNANFEALWNAMTLDKKNRGASVSFVVPSKRLGEVVKIDAPREAVQRAVFG